MTRWGECVICETQTYIPGNNWSDNQPPSSLPLSFLQEQSLSPWQRVPGKRQKTWGCRTALNSCTPWYHPVCYSLLSCGCGKILWQSELKEEVLILAHSSRAQSIMVGKERSFKQLLASQPQSGSRKATNALLGSQSIIDSPGSLPTFRWVFPHKVT